MITEAGRRPVVVVIGAGFGGLRLARALRHVPVDVLVIDRRNHHAFQPLFYEVATAGLDPGDIAQPVRSILRGIPRASFRLAEVTRVDHARRSIVLAGGDEVAYDIVVIAAGSTTAYFGIESARRHALPLKSLRDALSIRDHVLANFERATLARDESERRRLTSIVVVGGGPSGVEMAGAFAELQRHVLARDYPALAGAGPPVLLLEATPELLGAMPARLRRRAYEQLRDIGVEVRLASPVAEVTEAGVTLRSGEAIASANVVWVAGVQATGMAGASPATAARIPVTPTLQLEGHPQAFAIGDIAACLDEHGQVLPMLAPVALQQADHVARNIERFLSGKPPEPFRYRDRGTMATIGRSRAVAHVLRLQLSGMLAWWLWLTLHLYQIVGLRNRAAVLLNWTWNYLTYDRAHRVVVDWPETHGHDGMPDR